MRRNTRIFAIVMACVIGYLILAYIMGMFPFKKSAENDSTCNLDDKDALKFFNDQYGEGSCGTGYTVDFPCTWLDNLKTNETIGDAKSRLERKCPNYQRVRDAAGVDRALYGMQFGIKKCNNNYSVFNWNEMRDFTFSYLGSLQNCADGVSSSWCANEGCAMPVTGGGGGGTTPIPTPPPPL